MSMMPLAYKAAIYVLNRTFASTATAGGVNWSVPFTRMSGQRVNIAHIRTFGCDVTYRVPETQRVKSDPRGRQGILIGFTANPENYVILDNGTHASRSSRDIQFHEFDIISAEYERYISGDDEFSASRVPPLVLPPTLPPVPAPST